MKRKFSLMITMAFAAIIFTAILGWPTPTSTAIYAQNATIPQEPTRSVSVSGSGQVNVQPDMAVVQVGVQTSDAEATAALNSNSEQMQSLLDALAQAGVTKADVQTQSIQLQHQYAGASNGIPQPVEPAAGQAMTNTPQIVGYIAQNTVAVRVNDIDNLGSLLDSVVAAGGNQILGIRFEISQANDALEQARATAWKDAQQKAEQLADLAGAQLGNVLTINEFSRGPVPVAPASNMVMDAAAVPVQPGSQDVNVEVQITWQLR